MRIFTPIDDGGKKGGKDKDPSDGRNPSQDKKLTDQDIDALKEQGWDHSDKGSSGGGKKDLFYDPKTGEIYEKPKNGKGPGEPINWNIKDVRNGHSGGTNYNGESGYVAPGNHSISPVAAGATLGGVLILIGEYAWPLLFL